MGGDFANHSIFRNKKNIGPSHACRKQFSGELHRRWIFRENANLFNKGLERQRRLLQSEKISRRVEKLANIILPKRFVDRFILGPILGKGSIIGKRFPLTY